MAKIDQNGCQRICPLDCKKCFLDWRFGSGSTTVEIFEIESCNEHRRTGRGRWLINKLISELIRNHPKVRLIFAFTREGNFIAQQFYEAMKFRVTAPVRDFYQDTKRDNTIDAILYGRDIRGLP
jgi:ribosomal protein S18 acetylase RimI-like enzyme